MKSRCFRLLLTALLFIAVHAGAVFAGNKATAGNSAVTSQVQALGEKLLNDEGAMALIMTMQNDPEVQALLNDPAVVKAVAAGDIDALVADPRFMQLLNKPQVREIQQRVKP